jgi:diadenylate cyclase
MWYDFLEPPRLTWIGAIDILIVAFMIYLVLARMKGTRAVPMALGVLGVVGFFYFSRWSHLNTVSWLLANIAPYLFFSIIVIFQSEIRRALTQFGTTAFFRGFSSIDRSQMCDEIALAVKTLAKNQTGALIVVERDIGLKSHIESGIAVNGLLSYDLLVTVFNPKEPMHDGAVIIQNGRIAAAACFLPLTVKPRLSKELGTRHRAAIGITEETDAVAVVVSEETGSIAFAIDGEIERFLDFETLVIRLRDAIERRQPKKSVRTIPATVQHVDS